MIRVFQVDAFTDQPFRGNPAAVCLLERPVEPEWMQRVAAEMNLSETAFLLPEADGYRLRWFTPAVEVPLCGHATLASAHVLWEAGLVDADAITFHTLSGVLVARRDESLPGAAGIVLDFPGFATEVAEMPDEIATALGIEPVFCGRVADKAEPVFLLDLGAEQAVRELSPNLHGLRQRGAPYLLVTARADSDEYDFVSRFFAPGAGIDEDPVTGSAHCYLAPFWSERLGKKELRGYQASARGGMVGVRVRGDRVHLLGRAVTVLRGELCA